MGDLSVDTAVEGADGRYTATLSPEWEIWGPMGGYVAATALRAAGVHSSFSRPASLSCHYLGVASFDAVELHVTSLRATRRAESMRVSMTQEGRPILEALVWTVDEMEALSHDGAERPDVPAFEECKPISELLTPEQMEQGPPFPFWLNFDERPTSWIEDWENRPARPPYWSAWLRFRPRATFPDDPCLDACRYLILLDVCQWPAAANAYTRDTMTHVAPSLDLSAVFHAPAPASDWLLADGHSPVAGDGLVGGRAAVWTSGGRLVASGVQQMICRPVARSS